jgi:hypothetical protein
VNTILMRTVALAGFLSMAAVVSAQAETDPQAFAVALLGSGWKTVSSDKDTRVEMFSDGFERIVAQYQKLGSKGKSGYDPLAGARGVPVSDITSEIVAETDSEVTVKASFEIDGKPGEVQLVLDKTENGLRLNDIKQETGKSARQTMQGAIKSANAAPAGDKKSSKAPEAPKQQKTAKKVKDKKSDG